jgi:hypothetical protein
MSTIMTASKQWASRPADQRFTSLTSMLTFCNALRDNSSGRVVSSRRLEALPAPDDQMKGLVIAGPDGVGATSTHWSFGQLANRAGAPAHYMRDLPAPLAADCINYGLRHMREVEDLGVLLTRSDGDLQLRAVTGPNYGRVWDADIVQALVDRFGDGVTGAFKVPGEFGHDVTVTKGNTTLYASDRDMFVFLADEKNRIEIPNRRNGQPGSLARGFFVWNSEVGKSSYGLAMFLFDYVCCNRIVWGATDYQEIRGLHTSSAPDRWMEKVAPAISAYANASATPVIAAIEGAQKQKVSDVEQFLKNRKFNNAQIVNIKAAHLADEGRPMETLWDITTGITAFARNLPHQDERISFERAAGEVMDLAA